MNLRRFKDSGIKLFENYLCGLKENPNASPPVELLQDEQHSQEIIPTTVIAEKSFSSRFDAAVYLSTVLSSLEEIHDVVQDSGLWAWLSLLFFDQLCPPAAQGGRKPGELARYIPNLQNYLRYYRHLLAGPYLIVRAHRDDPERTLGLLSNPLDKVGDVFEQIASVQGILTAPGAIAAITELYYDRETQSLKRGAGGKSPGSARRLRDFLNQLDLTWDLYSTSSTHLLDLLPPEFQKYKTSN